MGSASRCGRFITASSSADGKEITGSLFSDKIRRPDPRSQLIFGSSCKPMALITCDDIHPRGPIPHGSECVCGKCHQFGRDYLDVLKRDAAVDARPDRKPATHKKSKT